MRQKVPAAAAKRKEFACRAAILCPLFNVHGIEGQICFLLDACDEIGVYRDVEFITVLAVIAEDFCESSLSLRFGVLQDNVVNAFLSGCANLAQKDGSQAK